MTAVHNSVQGGGTIASALADESIFPSLVTNMVRVGKRVRLRQKLIGAEPKAGGMQIKNECTIEIEGEDRPACVAETISVLYGA